MYTIRKKFTFEGAHVLSSARTSACKDNIHGHSYMVEVFLSAAELNTEGMVVDFGQLKEVMSPIIETLDHALLIHRDDPRIEEFSSVPCLKFITFSKNPTAENIAKSIHDHVAAAFPEFFCKVRIHETESGWAEYFNPFRKGGA